jgi:hypothetical protein
MLADTLAEHLDMAAIEQIITGPPVLRPALTLRLAPPSRHLAHNPARRAIMPGGLTGPGRDSQRPGPIPTLPDAREPIAVSRAWADPPRPVGARHAWRKHLQIQGQDCPPRWRARHRPGRAAARIRPPQVLALASWRRPGDACPDICAAEPTP